MNLGAVNHGLLRLKFAKQRQHHPCEYLLVKLAHLWGLARQKLVQEDFIVECLGLLCASGVDLLGLAFRVGVGIIIETDQDTLLDQRLQSLRALVDHTEEELHHLGHCLLLLISSVNQHVEDQLVEYLVHLQSLGLCKFRVRLLVNAVQVLLNQLG